MSLTLILPQNVIDDLEAEKREREEQERAQREAARYGAFTRRHYDESIDSLILERVQDAEPAIEFASEMRNAHPRNGYSHDRSIRHVGEVPTVTIEDWINRGLIEGINDNAGIRRMLADRDYSKFRTVDKL